jgi:hypothetical protein
MLRLIIDSVRRFLWDAEYAAVSLRAWLAGAGTILASVIATAPSSDGLVNLDQIKAWGWKGWGLRIGLAVLAAATFKLRGGDRNPAPDQIRAIANSPPGATPVPPPGA